MSGKAISFAMPDQGSIVREIERLTRLYIPIAKLPELPPSPKPQPSSFDNSIRNNHSPHRNRPYGRKRY
jgi:hypothetical protein